MKLYVGNLSFQTTENDLRDTFGAHGTVTDIHMIVDRETQRPRGFAFVTMSSDSEGQAAINAMHERELDGRTLTVNEARPMEPRAPRGNLGGVRRSSGGFRNRR
jgi:RNA recognition motif-containing protein